jgi:aspartyl-tRNA(Asn)/glutamyl-tRNA(Gln) amidotransferase subunit C
VNPAAARETALKVARLARLQLSDAEAEALGGQLGKMLAYAEQLGTVPTDGVEPLAHCLPLRNAFRDDARRAGLTADEALANAPKRAGDFYAVPAILD